MTETLRLLMIHADEIAVETVEDDVRRDPSVVGDLLARILHFGYWYDGAKQVYRRRFSEELEAEGGMG